MPYQSRPDVSVSMPPPPDATNAAPDWRAGLPALSGSLVTLRELSTEDATTLLLSMTSLEVPRFMSPPPADVEGFERFIAAMRRQRSAGECACFAIVPRGTNTAIGLFQVRSLEPGFASAEWGFAMASRFWGTGMFVDAARLAVDFAFDVIGAERLEARAAAANGRGNGALRKLGAVFEAVLRHALLRDGVYHDQVLWTILRDEWREAKAVWGPRVVLH